MKAIVRVSKRRISFGTKGISKSCGEPVHASTLPICSECSPAPGRDRRQDIDRAEQRETEQRHRDGAEAEIASLQEPQPDQRLFRRQLDPDETATG